MRYGAAFAGLILLCMTVLAACGGSDDERVAPDQAAGVASPTVVPPATPTADQSPIPTATSASTPTSTTVSTPDPTSTPTNEPEEEFAPEEPETAEPDESAEPVDPAPDEPLGSLPEEIDALLEGRDGFYSVVVASQSGEFSYWHDADIQMEAASLYKLPVMVELFRQREDGLLDFNDTVYMEPAFFNEVEGDVYDESFMGSELVIEDLLYDMVTVSSNVAAYALLELAGTENVNATMAELGLTATEIRWSPIAGVEPSGPVASYVLFQERGQVRPTQRADAAFNVTTAGDIALLFQLLLEGAVVSPDASAEMLELLELQQVNYMLPAGVPEGVPVAHKTGTLPGLIHDAGVIYTSSGPVVVVAMVESDYEYEAVDFIQQLAELVYAFST